MNDTPDILRADPVDLNDVSDCALAGRVLFIWDGHLVIGRYTGHSLDHCGLLTVDATHPATGRAEHKRVWRADVVPIPPELTVEGTWLDRFHELVTCVHTPQASPPAQNTTHHTASQEDRL